MGRQHEKPSLYMPGQKPKYANEMVQYAFQAAGRRQAIESDSGSIDAIMADRLGLIRSNIELVLMQLGRRKTIHHDILYQIDLDSVRADNLILEFEQHLRLVGGDRLALERVKFDLEKQRRTEEVSYFKDTTFLNKELKDSLLSYLGEIGKSAFLTEGVI